MTCHKLLLAASLSLGLATAAVAQTSTDPAIGGAGNLPMGWDGAIGDAFYSDTQAGTLRSEDEARANWDTLSSEQQAQVRSHCVSVDTAGATTLPDTGSDVTGSTGATGDQPPAGTDLPGAGAGAGADYTASIQQVCRWIEQ